MILRFTLKFSSSFGQSLYITGNHPKLGKLDIKSAFPMFYADEGHWRVQVEMDIQKKTSLEYQYILRDDGNGTVQTEFRTRKILLDPKSQTETIEIFDTWSSPETIEYCFETAMFDHILAQHEIIKLKDSDHSHRFEVNAPLLKATETLVITGNCDTLGNWDPGIAPRMSRIEKNRFAVQLDLSHVDHSLEYKYCIYDKKDQRLVQYEEGYNRSARPAGSPSARLFYMDEVIRRSTDSFWRGAGVAIPVFSLRSKSSLGVGEFADLKLMADWAAKTGIKLIQILPVNDTTANNNKYDSYPYAGVSVFALHPQYLKISDLPYKMSRQLKNRIKEITDKLNSSPTVQYEEMMNAKWDLIREIYGKNKAEFHADNDFKSFYNKNRNWLIPYAVFCVKRDEYGTPDFSAWKEMRKYSKKKVENFASENTEVQLHYFVQYHLHCQLSEAVAYLHKSGIVLKGDIPIGIYRHSCDAWVEPELYNMDMQAGAPPDAFAIKGQNWGFPTYNWEKMESNGFQWWKQRFQHMSQYFDSFRIDHILGFFRIWQIPMDAVEGIMGSFMPAIPVHINEFRERGIHFDYNRFCKPFITDEILWNMFGERMQFIKEQFLEYRFERYFFKPEYDTQRKILSYIDNNGGDDLLKFALFDLVSNVLFFEVQGSNQNEFHPRYGFGDTMSFKYLDDHTKDNLYQLYDDYFYKRQDRFWEDIGMRRLPAIKKATEMLICGEDLGMVPDCVPVVMKRLGILSLEVQRMPKDPKASFFHPFHAAYLSVVSPSSHDTSTLRGWWEEDATVRQEFYNHILGEWGEAPAVMTTDLVKKIIDQHFYCRAMLAIFPVQDYLGISEELRHPDVNAERINIPSKIPHFWNYRMHIQIEDLLNEDLFNSELLNMVKRSGR